MVLSDCYGTCCTYIHRAKEAYMHFLYQIVTSTFVYSLYDEGSHFLLHVLNLRTEESTDICTINKILDTLNEDTEVSFDDILEVEDVITTVLISED